ncbi:ribokinase [Oscillospiraceae bacterium LTW-04]|nr:ribokinase [Oscillospiraceae bacterium MB24-C1]
MKKSKILVVGSLVMDMIVSTERFPNEGETVLGSGFRTAPGGKGANQAVQAARLGADVTMVGKAGRDAFGDQLIATLNASGADTQHIIRTDTAPTAIGNILLTQKDGVTLHNRIIVVSGANMTITPDEVLFLEKQIAQYDMLMLQLEIPMAIVELVAEIAHKNGVRVMLNPAPSAPLSDALLSHLTYISPNEYEAADLTGFTIRNADGALNEENLKAAVAALHKKGVKKVIITLGDKGAVVSDSTADSFLFRPSVPDVAVADPTAAGDSFVGAFCAGVCAGLTDEQALQFASHTAAITVSRMGAMPSLPTHEEVLSAMKNRRFSDFSLDLLGVLKGAN